MKASHIIGSCCIMLTVVFTVYLAYVMLRRAKTVVLKDSCIGVFRHELIVCGCFLLFGLWRRVFLRMQKEQGGDG